MHALIVLLITLAAAQLPAVARATGLTSAQQTCANTASRQLSAVAGQHGRTWIHCLDPSSHGAGELKACLGDSRPLARAEARARATDARVCSGTDRDGEPRRPALFAPPAEETIAVAATLERRLYEALFGEDAASAIASRHQAPQRAACQSAAARGVQLCTQAGLRDFARCKRAALAAGASVPSDLTGCLATAMAELCSGRGIESRLAASCSPPGADLPAALPVCGASGDVATATACIERSLRCETCLALDAANELGARCDLLDDGRENSSCCPAGGCRPRVLVVGLDGADMRVLAPLIEAGQLPTIGPLVSGGASGSLGCAAAWPAYPCFCPPVWTAIATGQPADEHGITGVDQSALERRVAAIWNPLARIGGTTTLIRYRNTWPPEADVAQLLNLPGSVILAYEMFDAFPEQPIGPLYDDVGNHATPPDLIEQLGLRPYDGPRTIAWEPMASDRAGAAVLDALASAPGVSPTDLTIIIWHSVDKSEHWAWLTVQDLAGHPLDEIALLAQAEAWQGPIGGPDVIASLGDVASQYLEADRWLAGHLAVAHYDYIVFVSDHGMTRRAPQEPGLSGDHGPGSPDAHDAIFSVWGPGVHAGAQLSGSLLDVAPTLAYLLDLPVSRELPGRVLVEAFDPAQLARRPIRFSDSWETPSAP